MIDIEGLTSRPPALPALSFSIYPNPGYGDISIQVIGDSFGPMHLVMLDVKGQKVFELAFEKSETNWSAPIDLSTIAKGVYFLQLITKDGLLSKGVILK